MLSRFPHIIIHGWFSFIAFKLGCYSIISIICIQKFSFIHSPINGNLNWTYLGYYEYYNRHGNVVISLRSWLKFLCINPEEWDCWIMWNHKGPHRVKTTLRKNKYGGITLLDFKLYYNAIGTKQCYQHKRYTHEPMEHNQEPRIKSPHIQSPNRWQRVQEYSTEKRPSLQ